MTTEEGRRTGLLKCADEIDERTIFTKEWRVPPGGDRWAWTGGLRIGEIAARASRATFVV